MHARRQTPTGSVAATERVGGVAPRRQARRAAHALGTWRLYQSTAWRVLAPTPTLCLAAGWTLPLNTAGVRTREDLRASEAEDHMASMAVNELGPMLTATEVADMLHLHVNTVKRLGDRGELPFYRVCKRGDRRFRLDDVMKFLAQNR